MSVSLLPVSTTLAVRVARRWDAAQGIVGLELAALDGARLPAYDAGAHVDVHWGGYVRPYSLCRPYRPGGAYVVAVQREAAGRGGSRELCDSVRAGDVLRVSPPVNRFVLADGAAPVRLIAGGIGVTPLLCMAAELAAAGRPFRFAYLARSRRRMAFLHELRALCGDDLRLHVGDEATGRADLTDLVGAPAPGGKLYVCGPAGLIDAVQATALARGWLPENLHAERFSLPPGAGEGADDAPFDVLLARSGQRVHVPAGVSAVQALREAGIEVPVSCEQGACGVCLTGVLEGVPLHRDVVLTEAERAGNAVFLPCCSRAVSSTLTLDL